MKCGLGGVHRVIITILYLSATDSNNRLVITPPAKDDTYAVKLGKRYQIQCVYNHDDTDLHYIRWYSDLDAPGEYIDGESDAG